MADNAMKKAIRRIVRWASVDGPGTDAGAYQSQTLDFLRRPGSKSATAYPYGFNALAPEDTLSLFFTISGQSDNRTHMPISGPDRVKVAVGEVVIYHPATQAKVHFKADGSIDVESNVAVNVTSPDIQLIGPVNITGTLDVSGESNFEATLNANADLNGQNGIEYSLHEHHYASGAPNDTDGPQDP